MNEQTEKCPLCGVNCRIDTLVTQLSFAWHPEPIDEYQCALDGQTFDLQAWKMLAAQIKNITDEANEQSRDIGIEDCIQAVVLCSRTLRGLGHQTTEQITSVLRALKTEKEPKK